MKFTAQEFVQAQIDNLVFYFPNIQVRYELDTYDNTHIIEITPQDIFNNSSQLSVCISEMDDAFMEYYPEDLIGFITDDASYQLEDVNYTKRGILYATDSKAIKMDLSTLTQKKYEPFNDMTFSVSSEPMSYPNPYPISFFKEVDTSSVINTYNILTTQKSNLFSCNNGNGFDLTKSAEAA